MASSPQLESPQTKLEYWREQIELWKIETCKAHHVEPYAYLRYLLTRLPAATTLEELEALLPYHYNREEVNAEWLAEKNRVTITDDK